MTLAQAKQHLRVEIPDDDCYIADLVTEAREYVEKTSGRSLLTQSWAATWDRFPRYLWAGPTAIGMGTALLDQRIPFTELEDRRWAERGVIRLPRPPLQSVSSITYLDVTGVQQTLDPSLYLVDVASDPGRVTPSFEQLWPFTRAQISAVSIHFTAGYGTSSQVPKIALRAMRLLIGHWYLYRELVTAGAPQPIPAGVDALIALMWNGDYP